MRHGALLLPACLLCASCGASTAEADFRSPASSAKLDAITEAARRDDRGDVARLVEQLDSVDPAVRMTAQEALLRLTGTTHGYRYDDPLPERQAAIRRWVESVEGNPADG